MSEFTHMDGAGSAHMVDISGKDVTKRTATARGTVRLSAGTVQLINEQMAKKGDVLAVAQLAGITGAKRTADLIPLCHPLPLTSVDVQLTAHENPPRVEIEATASTLGRTGVEMEALTSVAAAALTVYDMVKSVDRSPEISDIRLVYKDGGKSGRFEGRE